jgi:hypothetical protein
LNERAGYVSSDWGRRQKAETAGKTNVLFQAAFAASPHDSKLPDTDHHSLPTAEMYSYEAVAGLPLNKIAKILNGAVRGTSGPKKLDASIKSLDNALYSNAATKNTKPVFYYAHAIDKIASLGTSVPPWTLNWSGGTVADWRFTPAMKKCLPSNSAAEKLIQNYKF